MKKISLILAAFALVLGISQCRKQETPMGKLVTQDVTFTSSFNNGAKVSVDNTDPAALKLKWEAGDIIKVTDDATPANVGTLTCTEVTDDGKSGTFTGTITCQENASLTFSYNPIDYLNQNGSLQIHLEGTSPYQESGIYTVNMTMPCAVLKLNVSALGTEGELKIIAGRGTVASVTEVSGIASSVFVAVPANEAPTEYTISCGNKIAKETWPALVANTFYTKDDGSGDGTGDAIELKPYSDPELLSGKFSVSAVDYVQFSRGNLQATYNGSGYDWAFAANQYDYIGNAAGNTTIASQADNAVVDMFGWSTGATNYGISTSTQNSSYIGDFKDWGTASGLPSAGEGKSWRTLSKAEWDYLLKSRTDGLCAWKGLDDGAHPGLVILPDGTNPSVMSSISSTLDLATYNAVFLPAAGKRKGTTMEKVGEEGFYWPSTPNGDVAYGVYFSSYGASTGASDRYFGYAVRLVQRFPKPIEYVEIEGLKWTKQNLAISDSGKKSWKGGNATAVKVPGSDEDVINGDYFQWATYAGYCGNETDADKGLLIYNSFTSEMCGDGSNIFTYKSDKQFEVSSTPYYSSSTYIKYTSGGATLGNSDDVANIILGGSWRMPTATEFNTMYNATYWAWDATDKGYYVYTPNPSTDAGKLNTGTGSYNKSNALLFFPAAGYGSNNYPNLVGNYGLYWSSNLNSDNPPFKASNLYFHSSGVTPQDGGGRYSGLPVRPVSY